MRRLSPLTLLASGFTACFPSVATAADIECYDAKVRAKPVEQIPTPYWRSDDPNTIVISWPWFVDLDVRRVIEGDVENGLLETLVVLHSSYVTKTRTFYLRRNSAGTFNILRIPDDVQIERCQPGTEPARPYIRPGPDQTLDDLRREAEADRM